MSDLQIYATSTIAISVYNFLAASGGEIDFDEIHEGLSREHHQGLSREQTEAAIFKLQDDLGYIAETENGYTVLDPQRRTIATRDRSDSYYNPTTRELEGGWKAWRIVDRVHGYIDMEMAMKKIKEAHN